MTPHYADDAITLHHGDALDVLRTLPDNSVHAVVTDPPAGIAFMGKAWDGAKGGREQWSAWLAAIMREALRVTKPGGHALVWALPRTAHWTACGLEDAGWEIRDRITHLFGSGFPKSLDVSKAIDRRPGVQRHAEFAKHLAERREAAGLTRAEVSQAVVGTPTGACWNWEHHQFPDAKWWPALRDLLDMDEDTWGPVIAEAERAKVGTITHARSGGDDWAKRPGAKAAPRTVDLTTSATDAARQWEGWGTALKPGAEDWWVARKPLAGTVAANVLAHGTGALNIDGCRVNPGAPVPGGGGGPASARSAGVMGVAVPGNLTEPHTAGRWPTNVVLDDTAAAELDRQSGVSRDGVAVKRNGVVGGMYSPAAGAGTPDQGYGGEGGASRFFPTFRYEPKAPTHERPRVKTEGAAEQPYITMRGKKVAACDTCGRRFPASQGQTCGHDGWSWAESLAEAAGTVEHVAHPTVKPLDLMRWLVRLVTPPGGTVLDMFAGSGTTGEACIVEGFRAILIEREPAYLPLIVARLSKPIQPDLFGAVADDAPVPEWPRPEDNRGDVPNPATTPRPQQDGPDLFGGVA